MPVDMGKPTRNELLAEYYLRAAGVAAVWIDAEGHVGATAAHLIYEGLVIVDPAAKICEAFGKV
jgi:hypothetical protein